MTSISPMKPRQRPLVIRLLLWFLLIGTPLLWLCGVISYLGHTDTVIFNRHIKTMSSLLFCFVSAPLCAVFCGLVIWITVVLPLQFLAWIIRMLAKVPTTRKIL